MSVLNELRPAATLLALFTGLCGLLYPLVVTGIGRVALPEQARGSLVESDGRVRGSHLVGQAFSDPARFWSRPSATARVPYDAAASTGTNQGPTHPALVEAVRARIEALRAADPGNDAPVPVDLVTASGSGLDPHISPAAALYQVGRVSRARRIDEAAVRQLVLDHVEERPLGLLGAPRVNVLRLNLALDRMASTVHQGA